MGFGEKFEPLTYDDGFDVDILPSYFEDYKMPNTSKALYKELIRYFNRTVIKNKIPKIIAEYKKIPERTRLFEFYEGEFEDEFALFEYWFQSVFEAWMDFGEDGEYREAIDYYLEDYLGLHDSDVLFGRLHYELNSDDEFKDFYKNNVYSRHKNLFESCDKFFQHLQTLNKN